MTNLHRQAVVPSPESYRFIPLTKNRIAIVDADDFDWLNQWKWCVHEQDGFCYAQRGGNPVIAMHRLIAKTPRGKVCDHWNGDTLDNRRINLRNFTIAQNNQNRKLAKRIYAVGDGRFRVRMTVNGVRYNGKGSFQTLSEAEAEVARLEKKLLKNIRRKDAPSLIERPPSLESSRPSLYATNTSGVTGVSRMKSGWRLMMQVDGVQTYIGYFPSRDKAIEARSDFILHNNQPFSSSSSSSSSSSGCP